MVIVGTGDIDIIAVDNLIPSLYFKKVGITTHLIYQSWIYNSL